MNGSSADLIDFVVVRLSCAERTGEEEKLTGIHQGREGDEQTGKGYK